MNIHPIQAMIDGMSAQLQRDRSSEQMTLGKMIERLKALPPEAMIDGIEYPHSYRGYYCDLAFERAESKMMASVALAICESAMGKVFEGYKGGEFQMGQNTPVWIANCGCCGDKIMAISEGGVMELKGDD